MEPCLSAALHQTMRTSSAVAASAPHKLCEMLSMASSSLTLLTVLTDRLGDTHTHTHTRQISPAWVCELSSLCWCVSLCIQNALFNKFHSRISSINHWIKLPSRPLWRRLHACYLWTGWEVPAHWPNVGPFSSEHGLFVSNLLITSGIFQAKMLKLQNALLNVRHLLVIGHRLAVMSILLILHIHNSHYKRI